MAVEHATADQQRESLVLEYFKRLDSGGEFLELFADDARVFYPKWGVAQGREEIGELFGDVAEMATAMAHDYEYFNYVTDGSTVVVEGTSTGEAHDGTEWGPDGSPGGGRWCDVFEVEDGEIRRLFIYLDPDYAGNDTERYPWL
jgi:ketosteroid isomerase-like protein